MEDHIQILIDYNGSVEKFGEKVLEEDLGYRPINYSSSYTDRRRTVSVKLIERKKNKMSLDKTPLYLLSSRGVEGYNLTMVLLLPKHRDMSTRDIKGHYSWVTQYLEANEIPFKCINPPREERKNPRGRITGKSKLESFVEAAGQN